MGWLRGGSWWSMGLGEDAVEHRVAMGRLHPVARGVYAVGHRVALAEWKMDGRGALQSAQAPFSVTARPRRFGGFVTRRLDAVDVTVSRRSTSSSRSAATSRVCLGTR